MSRAYISTWHNFALPYDTEYHKLYFEYFLEKLPLWKDLVDHIYLIDHMWGFSKYDRERLSDNTTVFESHLDAHGNKQLAEFLPEVKEDQILIMDNDCFIYDRKGVKEWFDLLGTHDAVVCWNNIGGLEQPKWNKYPFLKERKAQTFYSNHYAVSKEFVKCLTPDDYYETINYDGGIWLKELNYTTRAGDWTEGKDTMVYKLLERNNHVEMPIYPNQGWHHLHSVSWAYLLLTYKKMGEMERYFQFIQGQPLEKGLKIMNWFLTIDTKGKYTNEIKSVIEDLLRFKVHSFQ